MQPRKNTHSGLRYSNKQKKLLLEKIKGQVSHTFLELVSLQTGQEKNSEVFSRNSKTLEEMQLKF
jgi:hypothetical protein